MNKKFFRSIRFRIFLVLMALMVLLLVVIYWLQVILLPSYYQRQVFKRVEALSFEMVDPLANFFDPAFMSTIQNQSHQYNLCVYTFDKEGTLLNRVDPSNFTCYLNNLVQDGDPSPLMRRYIQIFEDQDQPAYYFTISAKDQRLSQLFYGRKLMVDNQDYYVFINSPYEILTSTSQVLNSQFFVMGLVVLLLGVWIAFLVSHWLSYPLVAMSQEAKKLAKGYRDVYFKEGGFSEIENLSQSLNFAMSEMAKNDNLRTELLANVSHDIRTPLTMISAYAQMIQDISGNQPDLRDKHLSIIIQEVDYLNKLLEDMMTLSQMELKTSRFVVQSFEANHFVQDIVTSFSGARPGYSLIFEVDGPPQIWVEADPIKLRQVVVNYLSNAASHVGDDKVILVRLIDIEQTGYARIEVEDHGVGIVPEDMDVIWERYYRSDKTGQRSSQGSGLGLAICKAICERGPYPYGVLSQPEEKTIFFVEIPLLVKD